MSQDNYQEIDGDFDIDLERKVSDLIGLTMKSVKALDAYKIIFESTDGRSFKMYHRQDCCESVRIDDICGDLDDLVGSAIIEAEEASNTDLDSPDRDRYDDTQTWTFYKFRTIKGNVTIRWYGHSNGYYSEKVDFRELKEI